MKKFTFLFFASILLLNFKPVFAQNLIAVQNGNTPKFFTDLTEAVANALDGDTLYVPGGTYKAEIVISKEIHMIGAGHNLDSTIITGPTRVIGNISMDTGSDRGSIEGIYLDGNINFGTYEVGYTTGESYHPKTIKGYTISRCNVNSIRFSTSFVENDPIRYSSINIIENIIRGVIITTSRAQDEYYSYTQVQSNTISNNIIMNSIDGLGFNCIIKNNIICAGLENPNSFSRALFLKGCIIDNNVILSSNGITYLYLRTCTVRNNLYTKAIADLNMFFDNLLMKNIVDQSFPSIFINYPVLNHTYSTAFDFHLKSDCPGKNSGTDGTDIGIYGGAYPWKEGSLPSNPHFQKIKIDHTTETNGILNVKIKVAAQDN